MLQCSHEKPLPSSVPATKLDEKIVLGWSRYFSTLSWLRAVNFRHCSTIGCAFTNNRSRLREASMIVFCCGEMDWTDDVPPVRYAWQRYVLMIWEAAVHREGYYDSLKDPRARRFFNLTATYRLDSDVYNPYGRIERLARPRLVEAPKGKTRFAIQFVSHCVTHSKRESVVAERRKFVDVDVYGTCGTAKCTCGEEQPGCAKCVDDVLRATRFYLAFENTVCRDYVTEKFFERLNKAPIVPVVLYGSNYKHIAPERSFIAVDDFESVEGLAMYLRYLAENETAYEEYLSWRETHVVVVDEPNALTIPICPLCQKLQRISALDEASIVDDPYSWWVGEGGCIRDFGLKFVGTIVPTSVSFS